MSKKLILIVVLVISAVAAALAWQPESVKASFGPAAEPTPAKKVKASKKPNRRKFDHIGNKQASGKVKHKPVKGSIPKHFGADMMEGNNIRQENPAGNGANNQPNVSGTGVTNSTPVKGEVPKHFGADMMEGSNIRQENPAGNGSNSTPVKGSIPKHFGADMLEGTNIKQENPAGNGTATSAPVKKPLHKSKGRKP